MNIKLLAVPYPYFKVITVTLLSSIVNIHADPAADLQQVLKQQQPDLKQTLPDWLKRPPLELDLQFTQWLHKGPSLSNPLFDGSSLPTQQSSSKRLQGRWIFVSLSMPIAELRAAAEEASERQAYLVFRGVSANQHIGQLTEKLLPIVKDLQPIPPNVIDPTLFTRFNVNEVPLMIDSNARQEIRRVRGLVRFDWLNKQGPGDLGQKGPTYPIAEPDMIEELQHRAEHYDWENEKYNAIEHFWDHQADFIDLPKAQQNTVRQIDVSVMATADILHPDGRMLVKKGQRLNPQTVLPMRHTYIVFDATDVNQVTWATELNQRLVQQNKPVVLLFSKFSHATGWKKFNEITDQLGSPIYKLSPAIVERFQLHALPSIIEGRGSAIQVTEVTTDSE